MFSFRFHPSTQFCIMELNDEQRRFVDCNDRRIVLRGNPGSGKTTTILSKLLHILHENEDATFLYCLFNKDEVHRVHHKYINLLRLQSDARSTTTATAAAVVDPNLHRYRFCTLHSLSTSIVRQFCDDIFCDTAVVCQQAAIVVKSNPYDILSAKVDRLRDLQYLFVDESQDLSQDQIDLVEEICYASGCQLIVVGDEKQNLYRFRRAQPDYFFGTTKRGTTMELRINYRSTKNIVNFCNATFGSHMVPSPTSEAGPLPRVYCGPTDSIFEDVVAQILQRDDRENIFIISSQRSCRDNIAGLATLVYLFENRGIKYVQHYKLGGSSHIACKTKTVPKKGHVNLLSSHASKGKERHTVMVLQFNDKLFSNTYPETKEDRQDQTNILFVACTRAKKELHLYVNSDDEPYGGLVGVDPGLYDLVGPTGFATDPKKRGGWTPDRTPTVTQLLNTVDGGDLLEIMDTLRFTGFDVTDPVQAASVASKSSDFSTPNLFSTDLLDYDRMPTLYGNFVEYLYMYSLCKYRGKTTLEWTPYISGVLKRYGVRRNTIKLPKDVVPKYVRVWQYVKDNGLEDTFFTANRWDPSIKNRRWKCFALQLKDLHMVRDPDFVEFLKKRMVPHVKYTFEHRAPYIVDDDARIVALLETIGGFKCSDDHVVDVLFTTARYLFSKSNSVYMAAVEIDMDTVRTPAFNRLCSHIQTMARDICRTAPLQGPVIFQKPVRHKNLNLVGGIDAYWYHDDDRTGETIDVLTDWKFVSQVTVTHLIQLVTYYTMFNKGWKRPVLLRIVNFNAIDPAQRVFQWRLDATDKEMLFKFNSILARALGQKLTDCIWVTDLETTGFSKTKNDIIDRHVQDLDTGMVMSTGLVRLRKEKCISARIEDLTGISTKMVDDDGDDLATVVKEINDGLRLCEKPRLVTHNAEFDCGFLDAAGVEPGLYKRICTLEYYRNTRKRRFGNKLSSTYERVTKKSCHQSHRAKSDVLLLSEIIRADDKLKKCIVDRDSY